jgi:hypothetical protein
MDGMPLVLWTVVAKTTVVHTVTYFAMGLVALGLFRYSKKLADPDLASTMRQTDDPLVRAGVVFQPIRGALFGCVFYMLRDVIFLRPKGWLILWATLVVIGIVSTFGPARGSIEGLIYTKHAFKGLWGGMIEVLAQSFLLSAVTYYWVNQPGETWLTWSLVGLFVIALALPALGLLASRRRPSVK